MEQSISWTSFCCFPGLLCLVFGISCIAGQALSASCVACGDCTRLVHEYKLGLTMAVTCTGLCQQWYVPGYGSSSMTIGMVHDITYSSRSKAVGMVHDVTYGSFSKAIGPVQDIGYSSYSTAIGPVHDNSYSSFSTAIGVVQVVSYGSTSSAVGRAHSVGLVGNKACSVDRGVIIDDTYDPSTESYCARFQEFLSWKLTETVQTYHHLDRDP